MRTTVSCIISILLNFIICSHALAHSETANYFWSENGKLAATCTFSWPDQNRLLTPQTVVVDNSMPDNTVLASWGYEQFYDFTVDCQSSGTHSTTPQLNFGSGSSKTSLPQIDINLNNYHINIHGVEFVVYGQTDTPDILCTPVCAHGEYAMQTDAPPLTEIKNPDRLSIYMQQQPVMNTSTDYVIQSVRSHIKYRAELIKSGTVSAEDSGKKVILNGGDALFFISDYYNAIDFQEIYAGTTEVSVLVNNCKLKTKDYTIPMGNWDVRSSSALPANGSEVPVNVSLQCDGETPHVRFRFEDAGTSLLPNHNLRLYDAQGNEKIDGLEIEMLYNGAHLDIDNTTLVDTGAHGTAGATGADSTAKFTARYVQRSEITKNGNAYVGPVTGKVNMWVTYD